MPFSDIPCLHLARSSTTTVQLLLQARAPDVAIALEPLTKKWSLTTKSSITFLLSNFTYFSLPLLATFHLSFALLDSLSVIVMYLVFGEAYLQTLR